MRTLAQNFPLSTWWNRLVELQFRLIDVLTGSFEAHASTVHAPFQSGTAAHTVAGSPDFYCKGDGQNRFKNNTY